MGRIKPSSASRWSKCPGSVCLSELYPEKSGESAEEGTAAHWFAEQWLTGKPAVRGAKAPNGVIVDGEMVDAARVYCDAAVTEWRKTPGVSMAIEQPLPIPVIHPTECSGKIDCWWFVPENRILHVWDFKYGFKVVDPAGNDQMICYAAGLLDRVGVNGLTDQQTTVVIHIVQPRAHHPLGPHRTWTVRASDLRGYINRLTHAAALATGPDPQCVSGDHCTYCSGRHACIAAQRSAYAAMEYGCAAVPQELSPEALSLELRLLQRASDAISLRLKGLEARAMGLIQTGTVVPGWAVDRGRGRKAWKKPVAEVIALGELFGVDLRDAITPAQALKMGLDDTLIKAYTEIPETGIRLVPQERSLTAQVFGAQ